MSPAPDADAARADGEARFKASLDRRATEKAAEPFDIISQGRLESLPSGMQAQVKWLLRRSAAAAGQANPENYAPASRQMALQSLVNAVEARAENQLATGTLEELALPETVTAIEALIGVRWSKIRAGMILADIRKLVRLRTQHMPAFVNERQKALAAADRRDIDHRVFPVSDYLRGARALRAIASVLEADHRVHGTTFARDAAMLAVQAKAHLRLGELHMLNVGNLKTRVLKDGSRILTIAATMEKVHGTRSIPIRDPDVITMLDPLRQGPRDTPLWRNADGTRMTYGGVAEALARTGNLAVGERAGSNIMRRAAMLDSNSAERRRILLGHCPGSLTAEEVYRRNESVERKAAMERGRLEMEFRVAERRSNIPVRRMKSRPTLRT